MVACCKRAGRNFWLAGRHAAYSEGRIYLVREFSSLILARSPFAIS